jgi:predicted nucleic acid-binding protein
VSLFVDTSVWSLAMRRDRPDHPVVEVLAGALRRGETICTTGLVLQEILQGFRGAKAREAILERFSSLPLLVPHRDDHVAAADLRTTCRRRGVQVGTIDVLLAQLCLRYDLTMLSTDRDFEHVARHAPLRLWRGAP